MEDESTSIEGHPSKRPNGRYAMHQHGQENQRPADLPAEFVDWEEKTMVDDSDEESSTDRLAGPSPEEHLMDDPRMRQARPGGRKTPSPARRDNPAAGRLIIVAGKDQGREIELYGKTITIGRGLDNDFVLTDISVSRKHLSIKFDGAHYRLIDHGSGNGTFINDRMETGSCVLGHGDQLEIGQTVMRLDHPASQGMPAPRGTPAEAYLPVPRESHHSPAPRFAPEGPGPAQAPYMARERPRTNLPPPQRERAPSSPPVAPAALPFGPASVPVLPTQALPVSRRSHAASTPAPLIAPVDSGLERGDPSRSSLPFDLDGPPGVPSYPTGSAPGSLLSTAPPSLPGGLSEPFPAVLPPVDLRPRRRGLFIGVVIVLAAAGAVAGSAVYFLRSGILPTRSGEERRTTPVVASEDKGPPLPRETWGTDETVLVASAGATSKSVDGTAKRPENETSPNGPSDPPDSDPPDSDSDDPPATNTTETSDPPTGDPPSNNNDRPAVIQDNPPKDRDEPERPRGNDSEGDARAIDTRARKAAVAQYRSRKFDVAGKTLRAAAAEVSGKRATSLRDLASQYERVGDELQKADSAKPVDAIKGYERALKLDQDCCDAAHESFLRAKLSEAAPKAAVAYMARSSYELARKAADKATQYGAGSNADVKKVRKQLEDQAAELFKNGLILSRTKPKEAKALYGRVLKIVPPSSPWHQKALKQL